MKGGLQAPLDLLANKVFLAWKAERGRRGNWDHQDPLGRKDQLDSGAFLAPRGALGTRDLLA